MPFVKLDTGILHSTLWFERDARELFITALLMAEPCEIQEPTPQLKVDTIENTGFTVPPGWYGFVKAAGIGIIRQAGMDRDTGLTALAELGNPDKESRSSDFDGRRLVRVDGGFIVLNYMKYRDRDATNSERSRRWRQRQKEIREQQSGAVAQRRDATENDTRRHQAEAEAEAEALKTTSKTKAARFTRPSLAEVAEYIRERKSSVDPEAFWSFYDGKGWKVGNQPMVKWKSCIVTWEKREERDKRKRSGAAPGANGVDLKRQAAERLKR